MVHLNGCNKSKLLPSSVQNSRGQDVTVNCDKYHQFTINILDRYKQ